MPAQGCAAVRLLGRSSSQNARGTLPRRAVLLPLAGTEAGFHQSLAAHAADLAGGHCCKCSFEGREAEISIGRRTMDGKGRALNKRVKKALSAKKPLKT